MQMLATNYHMAMFSKASQDRKIGQRYLLDINPHYTVHNSFDPLNKIDGRWIDTWTGLFIDITVARNDAWGNLECKDGHSYAVSWRPFLDPILSDSDDLNS